MKFTFKSTAGGRTAAVAIAAACWLTPCYGLLITQDAGSVSAREFVGGAVILDPIEVLHADQGATQAFRDLMSSAFDGRNQDGTPNPAIHWTYSIGATFNGIATIQQYDAFVDGNSGGAVLDLLLDGDGTWSNLYWIQIVETNAPRVPGLDPTVDTPNTSFGGDDNEPFYFTTGSFDRNGDGVISGAENEMANGFYWKYPFVSNPGTPNRTIVDPGANVDLAFLDASSRGLHPGINWDAWLYAVSWDGVYGGDVVIHDGVHRGWRMVPEPGSLALLGIGLACIGYVLRREPSRAAALA